MKRLLLSMLLVSSVFNIPMHATDHNPKKTTTKKTILSVDSLITLIDTCQDATGLIKKVLSGEYNLSNIETLFDHKTVKAALEKISAKPENILSTVKKAGLLVEQAKDLSSMVDWQNLIGLKDNLFAKELSLSEKALNAIPQGVLSFTRNAFLFGGSYIGLRSLYDATCFTCDALIQDKAQALKAACMLGGALSTAGALSYFVHKKQAIATALENNTWEKQGERLAKLGAPVLWAWLTNASEETSSPEEPSQDNAQPEFRSEE